MADFGSMALTTDTLNWAREQLKRAFAEGTSPQAMGWAVIDQITGDSTRASNAVDVYFYMEPKSWPMAVGYTTGQKDGLTGTCKNVPILLGGMVSIATPTLAKNCCKGVKLANATITIASGTDYPSFVLKLEPAKLVYHEVLEPAAGKRPLELFALIGGKSTWTVGSTEADYTWTDPSA